LVKQIRRISKGEEYGTNVTQYLVVSELSSAEKILFKRAQSDEFSSELLEMRNQIETRCINCVRTRPRFETLLMDPLPKQRVKMSWPFTITGVDFAGPLQIQSGIRRVTTKKAWIVVFVCFATRAIHFELIVGLISEEFLTALRRLMSRRGKSTEIYSNNATNFMGAKMN